MVRDKAFWFASAEGIHENRQLNFINPPRTPQFILDKENTFSMNLRPIENPPVRQTRPDFSTITISLSR